MTLPLSVGAYLSRKEWVVDVNKDFAVLVFGGRDFTDYDLLSKVIAGLERQYARKVTLIVHGGNGLPKGWRDMSDAEMQDQIKQGADALAHKWALSNNVTPAVFEADWDGLGKPAGPIRNSQMARRMEALAKQCAVHAVAFRGGRGTADMLDKLDKPDSRVPLSVVLPPPPEPT